LAGAKGTGPPHRVPAPALGRLWAGHFLQQTGQLPIAVGDLLLVGLPQLQPLAQREELFLFPAAPQAFLCPVRFLLLDLHVAQGQQLARTTFPLEAGPHHLQPAHADQVADDIVELEVHAFEGLLHLLHLAGRADEMVGPQTLVVLQLADVGGRHKAPTQQTVRVQRGQPLAVGHVRLAPRNVLHVPAIHHHYFQPGGFQHFIDIEPVDAGGFHRHQMHPLFPEPVAQTLQVAREGAEDFRRITGNGDMEFFAADINAGGLGIKHGQGFHNMSGYELNQQASRRVPGRHQKDKPPQREHRPRGITKQGACRRPEPVSPAGNPELQDAPEENAATLRPTTDAATSIRFRGSKREIPFGRILTPALALRRGPR
jgi:hypothetical protein